jgi:uncharacterized protein (DUF2249 family)
MRTKELDLRKVAHSHRRRTLLRRFDQLQPGDVLLLVSDSHPLPLVHWLSNERFGGFRGTFLEQTPVWRVEITRR